MSTIARLLWKASFSLAEAVCVKWVTLSFSSARQQLLSVLLVWAV